MTERERECLLWAARGKTNEEIGIILSISDSTVKAHLSGVAKKLNTHTKTQTVVEAIKRGMLVPW
ncbi:response regulator transcription factor [Iodidimonas muriae]|uniref:response regulator transcription factor n=1 Tax=Iodidimonas muriae TaxID=261467 RepID=UPI0027E4871A|nr:helix-turn-helix transcriptional regulator [Iodidimonas muriae]